MKKINLFFILFIFVFSFGFNIKPKVFAYQTPNPTQINIRGYGDSISAGYGLEDHRIYEPEDEIRSGDLDIVNGCFTEVFSRDYLSTFGGSVKGYGLTGLETTDLANILAPYLNGNAEDQDEFLATDIFTLAIGSNNILHAAFDNMIDYIFGNITEEEIRELLKQAVNNFRFDYNQVILPALTLNPDAKVVVLTIYNPAKYINFSKFTVNTGSAEGDARAKTALKLLDQPFKNLMKISMVYAEQINAIIRSSESENVYVADTYRLFEGFTEEEYLRYINANPTKVVITDPNLADLNADNMKANCDPHPTKEGHEAIAHELNNAFRHFELVAQTEISGHTGENAHIGFKLYCTDSTGYSFRLCKRVNNHTEFITQSFLTNINTLAKYLSGEGEVFVEVYKNGQRVCATNSLAFSNAVFDVSGGMGGSQSSQTSANNQENSTLKNVAMCVSVLVSIMCLIFIGVDIFTIIRKNKYKTKK